MRSPTTVNATDDAVAELSHGAHGAEVFRGSEQDVLSRYVGAARAVGADLVCRVTSDCRSSTRPRSTP